MRFKIGDLVRVREDLIAGLRYYNDNRNWNYNSSTHLPMMPDSSLIFPVQSARFMGRYGVVVMIVNGTYILNISGKARFVDGMLYKDNYSDDFIEPRYLNEYKDNADKLLNHTIEQSYKSMIDKSLENGDIDSFKYYSDLLIQND